MPAFRQVQLLVNEKNQRPKVVHPLDRGRPAKDQLLEDADFSQLIQAEITKPRLQQKCLMWQEIADDLRLRIAT